MYRMVFCLQRLKEFNRKQVLPASESYTLKSTSNLSGEFNNAA
jgi:hypothetical protein